MPKRIPSAMLTKARALVSKGQKDTASVTTDPSLVAYKPAKLPPIQRKPTISVNEAYSQNYARSHKKPKMVERGIGCMLSYGVNNAVSQGLNLSKYH
jgi:hypothetical protein